MDLAISTLWPNQLGHTIQPKMGKLKHLSSLLDKLHNALSMVHNFHQPCGVLQSRPSDGHGGETPHKLFHRHIPNLSKAFIFGLPLHIKICHLTCHHPDPHTLLGTFIGFQGTSHVFNTLAIQDGCNTQPMQ